MWVLAGTALLKATVKSMTCAAVRRAATAACPRRFALGATVMRPCIWSSAARTDADGEGVGVLEGGGLRGLEARWLDPMGCSGEGAAVADGAPDPDPYFTLWMVSSSPRRLPLERAVVAAQERTSAPPQGRRSGRRLSALGAAVDDLAVHAAAPGAGSEAHAPPPAVPWQRVWSRLHRAGAPREQWTVAWRLLHGALFVHAYSAHVLRSSAAAPSPTCPFAGCQDPETLSHAFLECGAAARVVRWVRALWFRIEGTRPPALPEVFLSMEDRGWLPTSPLRRLWDRLRMAAVFALWQTRSAAARSASPSSADAAGQQAVARLVADLRQQVLRDWQRVLGGVGEGVIALGLIRERLELSRESFESMWCVRGVIASVSVHASQPPSLTIRLSA